MQKLVITPGALAQRGTPGPWRACVLAAASLVTLTSAPLSAHSW